MRNQISTSGIFAAIITLTFLGTAFINDANAQGVFQKRKHRKGFYIDLSRDNSKKEVKSKTFEAPVFSEVEIKTTPAVKIQEQEYELALETEVRPYQNVEITIDDSYASTQLKKTGKKRVKTVTEPQSGLLGLKTKKENNLNEMAKWNKVKRIAEPQSEISTTIDPGLRRALIVILIGLIVNIFWIVPVIGWIFGIIGSIIILIGLVLLILWLIDNV